jgi:lipopolysaccharide export system permease protein
MVMFGSILNRMILWELFKVFTMSLTALTGMFLLAGLIQEASQKGYTASQILMAIPFLVPNSLPFTIPATTLFATCVVYGRMSNDNEILVLKAAGVNILHLLKPAIILGIVTTGITMFLYYDTIPMTQQLLRQKVMSEAEEVLYATLKRDRCLRHGNMPYVIFVREVQGKRLIDVIFKKRAKPKERDEKGNLVKEKSYGYDVVIRAREAKLRVDLERSLISVDLEQCSIDGDQAGYSNNSSISFDVELPEAIFGKDPKDRPSSLTWDQLKVRYIEVQQEVEEWIHQRDEAKVQFDSITESHPKFEEHKKRLFDLNEAIKSRARLGRVIEVEQQFRPAIAVGCLCFVLIGCPVGIWASRRDYLSSFIICFLPTVMLYYPLLLAGTGLGKDGKVPIPVATWAADAILGTIALGLIWRLMRR